MHKKLPIFLILFSLSICTGCVNKESRFLEVLNQPPPGATPELFFPNLLLSNVRDVAFTPEGKEFYFTHIDNGMYRIMQSVYQAGEWSVPSVAPFSGVYNDFEPCISPNGKTFYFASMRPSEGKEKMINDIDIWVMERKENGWSDPSLLDDTVNTNCMEYYPSVTREGTLYFGRNDLALTRGDIHFSQRADGQYTKPEKLPANVNLPTTSFNAYIAPDESYIIFSTYIQDSLSAHSDLHISFRDRNGNWSESRNLGEPINSKGHEISPWVSHEGNFLFFASTRLDTTGKNQEYDIFWVDAEVLEK